MSDGGCINGAECDAANNCKVSLQIFRCCRYQSACFTDVIGLVGRKDQTIDGATPKDAILHAMRIPGVGFRVLGDSTHFKAGDLITEIDGKPAHDTATWDAWLKSDTGIFTVLDADSHKSTTRTITRL